MSDQSFRELGVSASVVQTLEARNINAPFPIQSLVLPDALTGADILAVGHPDVDALTAAVLAALRRCGLPHPTVEMRVVDRIPRHQASGKLKRFIALS